MWAKIKFFVYLLIIFVLSNEASAKNKFILGRRVGGNVLKPPGNILTPRAGDEWFTQKLDHFDPTNTATWQQRFFSNSRYYREGGPVFLFISGESEAAEVWMNYGSWIDYARTYNALLFQLEHRYYGPSHPTEDLSVENLRYLTSQQALADLAVFIDAQNKNYNLAPDVKWIAFGGSYSGSLAAWLRLKYPHLVLGAVSSSGPLEAIVDFTDYFKIVVESLSDYNEECISAITEGMNQIDDLLKDEEGQESLNTIFKLCDPLQPVINDTLEIDNFYSAVAGNFAGVVQYNNISASLPNIPDVCNAMTDISLGTPVQRLGVVNDIVIEANSDPDYPEDDCLDYRYKDSLADYQNSSWDAEVAQYGIRQWLYQTCTEFAFYQTSSDPVVARIFGDYFPIETYYDLCEDIYGPTFNEELIKRSVDRTNNFYGALDIEVTNVVFFHGSTDPWHALGILEDLSDNSPALFVNGVAHCANMYSNSAGDPQDLVNARTQIGDLIGIWLNQ